MPDAGARRDAVAVLVMHGCRRSEPAALDLADDHPATDRLRISSTKGGKHREVYLTNRSKRTMDPWIELRGGEPGLLLAPVGAVGRICSRRLSGPAMHQTCLKLRAPAGTARSSSHDPRRTFAADMLDAGADEAPVRQ